MNRKQIEQVLSEGRVVVWKDKVISAPADIPTDIELARGNKGLINLAVNQAKEKLAELQADIKAAQSALKDAEKAKDPAAKESVKEVDNEPVEDADKGSDKDVRDKKATKANKKG